MIYFLFVCFFYGIFLKTQLYFLKTLLPQGSWCCCCLVAQLCPTLCDPKDCSMPGIPVPHHHQKFAQVHVHCISDAIQSSHPLMPSSPFALDLSQHQGLFHWVICSHQMTKILKLQLQHPSFQWIFRVDSLKIDWFDLLAIQGAFRSLLQHHSMSHQFFGILPSLRSSFHNRMGPLGRQQPWLYGPLSTE